MKNILYKIYYMVIPILLLILACQGRSVTSGEDGDGDVTHTTPPTQSQLGELPPDAGIIFLSSRWDERGGLDIPGDLQIYAMNENGGNVVQMTYEPTEGIYEHAAVSFDRRYIVANINIEEVDEVRSTLWVYDLEKKTTAQLVPEFYSAGRGGVDWSPDGFIFFAAREKRPQSMADFGAQDIYRIRPDGTGLTRLTTTTESVEIDVSVSEDGMLVAYVNEFRIEQDGRVYGKPQIWVMNADGTSQRMVFDGGPEPPNYRGEDVGGHDPEISPDNTLVVFSRVNSEYANFPDIPGMNTAHDLFIVNIDGTGMRRLTPEGAVNVIPDWHNDKILYNEYNDPEGYVGFVVINPDSTGRGRLESGLTRIWDGGRFGKWIP